MLNMRLLIAAAAAGTLLSCGQKGPLVLPDAQHPHKKIGVGKPATPVPSGGTPSSDRAPQASPGPAPQS